jgi:hypothetical protein
MHCDVDKSDVRSRELRDETSASRAGFSAHSVRGAETRGVSPPGFGHPPADSFSIEIGM